MKQKMSAELREHVSQRAQRALVPSFGAKAAAAATLVDVFHVERVVMRERLEPDDDREPRETIVVLAPKKVREMVQTSDLHGGFGPLGTCSPRTDLEQASNEARLAVKAKVDEWERDSERTLPAPEVRHEQADIALLRLRGTRCEQVVSLSPGEVLGELDRGRAPVAIMTPVALTILSVGYQLELDSDLGQLLLLLFRLLGWGLAATALALSFYYKRTAPKQSLGLPVNDDWS